MRPNKRLSLSGHTLNDIWSHIVCHHFHKLCVYEPDICGALDTNTCDAVIKNYIKCIRSIKRKIRNQ